VPVADHGTEIRTFWALVTTGGLPAAHRYRDRGEQSFARTDVVQQHAVAGADRGGHFAQAQVRDPSLHGHGDSSSSVGLTQPCP
jgi:hypothetical protein